MKVMLLSNTRSKSNLFLSTLSLNYNIQCLFEPYRNFFSIETNFDDNLFNLVKQKTQELKNIDNYALKLETILLITNSSLKLIDLNLFNFKNYDLIYTCTRKNMSEFVASLAVATNAGNWVYLKDEKPLNIEPREFSLNNPNDKKALISAIKQDVLLKEIQSWFIKNNINYKDVYYETIDEYIKSNFNGVASNLYTKTNYDYKKIFTNYEFIDKCVEKFKSELNLNYKTPEKYLFF